jgi:hypothetical protein
MSNEIVINTKPKRTDIFNYKIYHTFFTYLGVFRILFSLGMLALAFYSFGKINWYETLCLVVLGLLNPVAAPIMFWIQSVKLEKMQAERKYAFSESGITISEGKEHATIKWRALERAIWSKRELLLYTSAYQALVVPKSSMKGRDMEIWALVKSNIDKSRVRICKIL